MKPFSACVFVALLSGALASPGAVAKWESFKAKHAKQHAPHEEAKRMQTFLEHDAEIEAHNERFAAGLESYSMQHSQYSDLSPEEYRASALGFVPAVNASDIPHAEITAMPGRPAEFSWRPYMTPTRNQLYCGSCYAFAGAGALEGYLNWKGLLKNVDLSEQDVVDCSYKKFMGGNHNGGCSGGWPTAVNEYYNSKGLVMEHQYKYTSGQSQTHGPCQSKSADTSIKGKLKIRNVRPKTEDEMADLLVTNGPMVIAMAADNEWKRFFDKLGKGVFDNPAAIGLQPNHAVVLVGYGRQDGKDYWLIKNSWGAEWADGGYGKIVRGKNMCSLMNFGVFYVEQ